MNVDFEIWVETLKNKLRILSLKYQQFYHNPEN